jgi:hypothetical protein
MKHRKLRIAWSAFALMACIWLASAWVQDYRQTQLLNSLPYAYPILLAVGLAALPWADGSIRFSLRTLLIGMTVAAVALGLIFTLSQ